MSYSYATAKAVLSDVDKDRILAMHLSQSDISNVDWDKATQAYGAASVESMRVSYRNLLKKIEKAGGKTDVTAPHTGADGSASSSAPKTPKTPKTPRGKGGRPPKRKAHDTGSDEDEDAPNSLRKKAAKNMIKAEDEDEDDDETNKVPKKVGRSRKTPVKHATKTALRKAADGNEDTADNSNDVPENVEAAKEDDQTPGMIKEEDQSEY
ncbi:hypothetical protein M436DRAFT_39264 [Aureobasidium namibiae CBS 147.97]|uniref:Myb-like domain-containing protein n=1 Tax=Aureobasidium namibiae CBS 147.97 TaxID=1043004 RepID=A0A074WXK2_9PEZI